MKKILLMHGANLNRLGLRDPEQYGTKPLQEIEALMAEAAKKNHYALMSYQSNHEGCLIDFLQENALSCVGIIINPGAFSHYSYALYDALVDTGVPVIEVHLSSLEEREVWRRTSVTAAACRAVISGKKEQGYLEALTKLIEMLDHGS